MERKYTILSMLLVILALALVILPKKENKKEVDSKKPISAIAEKSRYLTVDQIAHRIIENDPTLLLVDLRDAGQFKKFALTGAINIHPDSLVCLSSVEIFSQQGKDKVLYANEDITRDMIQLIDVRFPSSRIYMMKGGFNEWTNTILKEQTASATASSSEIDLINFRTAARQYFTGESKNTSVSVVPKTSEKITITRKAPAASSGGGC
ncbi:MAG: rhodanese-like domain-containing protein [Prolixibacteraceae bacterium]